VSEFDRRIFWEEMPGVRILTAHTDGSLSGYELLPPQVFGGHIPNVGDVIGDVWEEGDYDFQTVLRRYFIREFAGDSYWVLVVKDSEPDDQFDHVSNNVLLATDLNEVIRNMDPQKPSKKQTAEIEARIAQLSKSPIATKNFKPKARLPDED
jgi:hypothetical protein